MAQSKLKTAVKKTVATAAMGGLMLGATAYLTGCMHDHDSGAKATSADGTQHSCKGLNSCKGRGGCKTADHGCKGMNACKGQGGCKAQ